MSLIFAPDVGIAWSHYMVLSGLSQQKVDGEGGGVITNPQSCQAGRWQYESSSLWGHFGPSPGYFKGILKQTIVFCFFSNPNQVVYVP